MGLSSLFKKKVPSERFYSTENQHWCGRLFAYRSEELYAEKYGDTWTVFMVKRDVIKPGSIWEGFVSGKPMLGTPKTITVAKNISHAAALEKLRAHEQDAAPNIPNIWHGKERVEGVLKQTPAKSPSWHDMPEKPKRLLELITPVQLADLYAPAEAKGWSIMFSMVNKYAHPGFSPPDAGTPEHHADNTSKAVMTEQLKAERTLKGWDVYLVKRVWGALNTEHEYPDYGLRRPQYEQIAANLTFYDARAKLQAHDTQPTRYEREGYVLEVWQTAPQRNDWRTTMPKKPRGLTL